MTEKKLASKVLLSALDNYGGFPFNELYDLVIPAYGADDIKSAVGLADKLALIIWGGQDISPTIYGQKPSRFTGADVDLSKRDQYEVEMALAAMELGIPIIGICRGAQLMCALSGGILVQDVNGHAGGWHKIVTKDGREFNCPSLHHQMMYPWHKEGGTIDESMKYLAWCDPARSDLYHGQPVGEDDAICEQLKMHWYEPEILYFGKTKSLCIQSHPEFIDNVNHPFVQYCLELTKQYILEENV